jgi:hypothetical protein
MIVVLVLVAAAFGAGDQYLGSWAAHSWATETSLLSAPWLLLPLLVGYSQRSARRAVALACVGTSAALIGYLAMTLSPIEQAKVTLVGVIGLLGGQLRWFIGGAITSPLLGWLGYRWRAGISRWVPLLAAAVVCLEPLVRSAVGQQIRSSTVRWGEILAGMALAVGGGAWWAVRPRASRTWVGSADR